MDFLESQIGSLYEISCKVVIYNYVSIGFYSVLNFIVIIFNLMYPVLFVGFHCKGCM